MAIGAEHLAQRGDLGLEVVLLDDPVGPDAAHQLVLADDGGPGVDEGEERGEGTTTELDQRAVDEELAAIPHDLEAAERQDRGRAALPAHSEALNKDASAHFITIQP